MRVWEQSMSSLVKSKNFWVMNNFSLVMNRWLLVVNRCSLALSKCFWVLSRSLLEQSNQFLEVKNKLSRILLELDMNLWFLLVLNSLSLVKLNGMK